MLRRITLKKKQKTSLISISRLLILLDMIILIMLTQNIYIKEITIYSIFRLFYLSFIVLGIFIKTCKTTIILMKKYNIFSNMRSYLSDEEIDDRNEVLKNFYQVIIFFLECTVPMNLYMYTLQNSREIIRSSNNVISFSGLLVLNIALEVIFTYIKKRSIYITDSLDQKESKAS